MLAPFADLLTTAGRDGRAVGAFTCYDASQAAGVLDAAEQRGAGVVLLVSPGSFRQPRGEDLIAAFRALASASAAAACVQLDHVRDLASVSSAFQAGAGAVMVDGSHLPLQENREMTREAVRLGAARGGEVECELGGIAGDEDVARAIAAGALTDPDGAAHFMSDTGASCLAVSIGNVHGHYRDPPDLDFERLAKIRAACAAPLSLHGASGIPAAQLQRSVRDGIVKVNVNTELRQAYVRTLDHGLDGWRPGADLQGLTSALRDATAETVDRKLIELGW